MNNNEVQKSKVGNNTINYQNNLADKLKLIDALKSLRRSWIQCEIAFIDNNINYSEYIVDQYPFDKPFSDIDVVGWVNESIKKLENSL